MASVENPLLRSMRLITAVSALVLMNLAGMETQAQDTTQPCPCFNLEEVESIFLRANKLTSEEGQISCSAQDYSVEFNAEIVILDLDYSTVAQARVAWYDFDPSSCAYIDPAGNPGVDRNVRTPHPAPEAPSRACFDAIISVIGKSDTSGKCSVYP